MNEPVKRKLSNVLSMAFSRALADLGTVLEAERIDPLLQQSRHAHFQANAAMKLGKQFKIAPKAIAEKAAEYAVLHQSIASAQVAGPGFMNITIADTFLSTELFSVQDDPRLGVPLAAAEVVVVDYSSPNVAKEMHVGHLRSTVIGDACARLFEWLGHSVIRRNHIGDWGTPFGMLIEHLDDLGESASSQVFSLGDLNSFYRAAREKFDANSAFRDRARARVVSLQAGNHKTVRLWNTLVEQSQRYFLEVYEKVGVRLDHNDFRGESAYNDKLESIVAELREAGLLETSDSAECVFIDGFFSREGTRVPLIVRKSDGGFGYAATDLAALRERTSELQATRILYVVGAPQRQHFEMIFAVASQLGWLSEDTSAEHIAFGSVLGSNGKMLASRSGESVKLVQLLDDAIAHASRTVAQKNPMLQDAERKAIANAVGVGAVKYADLSVERQSDYVFDLEKMLALEGNTAPYLQYANARINSMLREGGYRSRCPVTFTHQAERDLALALLDFPVVIEELEKSLHFNRLAKYLYELAASFSRFYAKCPILKADNPDIRAARLSLASHCGKTLQTGLALLGIQMPDRM